MEPATVKITGIDVDVLVVGSGSAGIMAAIRAKQADANVLLVTKGQLPSGNSCKALSGYVAAFGHSDPRDNPDADFADVVRNSVGLSANKICSTENRFRFMTILPLPEDPWKSQLTKWTTFAMSPQRKNENARRGGGSTGVLSWR